MFIGARCHQNDIANNDFVAPIERGIATMKPMATLQEKPQLKCMAIPDL
jgi:hypothetical protein